MVIYVFKLLFSDSCFAYCRIDLSIWQEVAGFFSATPIAEERVCYESDKPYSKEKYDGPRVYLLCLYDEGL